MPVLIAKSVRFLIILSDLFKTKYSRDQHLFREKNRHKISKTYLWYPERSLLKYQQSARAVIMSVEAPKPSERVAHFYMRKI